MQGNRGAKLIGFSVFSTEFPSIFELHLFTVPLACSWGHFLLLITFLELNRRRKVHLMKAYGGCRIKTHKSKTRHESCESKVIQVPRRLFTQ